MTKLQQGETEIAWGLPPFIVASYQGQDPYKDKHPDMRLVMNGLGFVHIQWCVPADSPYKSIREIFESKKAITIGTTPPGGSDEWVMRKVFEFYKTTYSDVRSRGGKVILVSYTDLANQYRDRNMDILFANLAVPGAAIQEASLGRKMRILPMDDDLIKFMEGVGLSRGVIPKGSYKDVTNNDQDIPTIAMANTIVANAKVPQRRGARLRQGAGGQRRWRAQGPPGVQGLRPQGRGRSSANIPLHPGAERAYREAGLLK